MSPSENDRSPTLPRLAAKADDLEAILGAVVDAAMVSAGLWLSYLFVLFYLLIAVGGVTHLDLFLENPVKLPFLNIDLPMKGFSWLGPALFIILHAYVLLHFVLLASKIGVFDTRLRAQIDDSDTRAALRRQLPSNIFVQLLAGPREVRNGFTGLLLRLITIVSLVIGPIALLVFFQLQLLPYHSEWITWWHRTAVALDFALLWILWPAVARGEAVRAAWRGVRWVTVAWVGIASAVPILLVFAVATFPGEWLQEKLSTFPLRETLLAGNVDLDSLRPTSLWSNRLVLPAIDVIDHVTSDSGGKIVVVNKALSLRVRHFEGAILSDAVLRNVDFTAAHLEGAYLRGAFLEGAQFNNAHLEGAHLDGAHLEGASLVSAKLQDAELHSVHLEGVHLDDAHLEGAQIESAYLQGAYFTGAYLQGASLHSAHLQGAWFDGANLQAATLDEALLQGASLTRARLQAADLYLAQLQGAVLDDAHLEGALLDRAELRGSSLISVDVWRASLLGAQTDGARVGRPTWTMPFVSIDDLSHCTDETSCDADTFEGFRQRILEQMPEHSRFMERVQQRLERLDPRKPLRNEDRMKRLWDDSHIFLPTRGSYDEGTFNELRAAGCKIFEGPRVIAALIEHPSILTASNDSILASEFLGPNCAGAQQISIDTRERLENLLHAATHVRHSSQ